MVSPSVHFIAAHALCTIHAWQSTRYDTDELHPLTSIRKPDSTCSMHLKALRSFEVTALAAEGPRTVANTR